MSNDTQNWIICDNQAEFPLIFAYITSAAFNLSFFITIYRAKLKLFHKQPSLQSVAYTALCYTFAATTKVS